jgi:S1-C subfamily serine protease
VVEFDDAMVVKALVEDGRMVGKIEFHAEVVRYSAEEDLALLRLRKKDFIRARVLFYLDKKDGKPAIPPVGTKLLHVGSLLGQLGSNSMTRAS